jgi:Holliday junction resolvase RusA-like endonuclease
MTIESNLADEVRTRMFPEAAVVIQLSMPPTLNNLFINKGRGRIDSPKYAVWKRLAGWELLRQHPPRIKGPVSVLIEVSLAESNDTWDLCNREKAAMDLLVTHGVIQGDNRPIMREFAMRWADVAGVRVTITGIAP